MSPYEKLAARCPFALIAPKPCHACRRANSQDVAPQLGGIALVALPVAAGWLISSVALGRVQEYRAALIDRDAVEGEPV